MKERTEEEEIESVFAHIGQATVRFSTEKAGEGPFCSVNLGTAYLALLAKRQLQGYTLRKHRLHLTASDATGCATLFIGNLSYQATESSLLDLFSTVGSVADIRIVREGSDGHSCFGFVDFFNQLDSAKAMEQLQGTSHMGRALRLDEERVERVLGRCPPKRDGGPWEAAGIFSKGPRHGPDPRSLAGHCLGIWMIRGALLRVIGMALSGVLSLLTGCTIFYHDI
eukprot:s1174_g7.t1